MACLQLRHNLLTLLVSSIQTLTPSSVINCKQKYECWSWETFPCMSLCTVPSSNTGAQRQHILNFNMELAVSCFSQLYLQRKNTYGKKEITQVDLTVHLYTLVKKKLFVPAGIWTTVIQGGAIIITYEIWGSNSSECQAHSPFWDEMLCSPVVATNILDKPGVSNFHPEDRDSKLFQNMVASYQTMWHHTPQDLMNSLTELFQLTRFGMLHAEYKTNARHSTV